MLGIKYKNVYEALTSAFIIKNKNMKWVNFFSPEPSIGWTRSLRTFSV